jgi:hypothetical protein
MGVVEIFQSKRVLWIKKLRTLLCGISFIPLFFDNFEPKGKIVNLQPKFDPLGNKAS